MRLVENVVGQGLDVGDALLRADERDKEGAVAGLFHLAPDGSQRRLHHGRALVVLDGHRAQPVRGVRAHHARGLAQRAGAAQAGAPVRLLRAHGLLQRRLNEAGVLWLALKDADVVDAQARAVVREGKGQRLARLLKVQLLQQRRRDVPKDAARLARHERDGRVGGHDVDLGVGVGGRGKRLLEVQ